MPCYRRQPLPPAHDRTLPTHHPPALPLDPSDPGLGQALPQGRHTTRAEITQPAVRGRPCALAQGNQTARISPTAFFATLMPLLEDLVLHRPQVAVARDL